MNLPHQNTSVAVEALSTDRGEPLDPTKAQRAMALLALSHTQIEHLLYDAMLNEASAFSGHTDAFSARRLMLLTGIRSSSTVRRGLRGLLEKQSIERVAGKSSKPPLNGASYTVFNPEEVFTRRKNKGLLPLPKEINGYEDDQSLGRAIQRVAGLSFLSRREAQVALCCAEGLTNSEIGTKLNVTVQTVKFHLRHIFVKFGVKRRTELILRLLKQGTDWQAIGEDQQHRA